MATLRGNANANRIYGTTEGDRIVLFDGDDFGFGAEGNDNILGGAGNDVLFGFINDDLLRGEAGNDTLVGGTGDDVSFGGDGDDQIIDAADRNYLAGQGGNDLLVTAGTDAGGAQAVLSGGDGNDQLEGGIGAELHWGGDGDDIINGRAGLDFLYGGRGVDRIDAGIGTGAVFGGAGGDFFFVRGDVLANGAVDRIVFFDFQVGLDVMRVAGSVAAAAGSAVQGNVDLAFIEAAVDGSTLLDADFATAARNAGDFLPSRILAQVVDPGPAGANDTVAASTITLTGGDQLIFVGLTAAQADALF